MLSVKKCVGFGQSLNASVHVKIDNIGISHHKRLRTTTITVVDKPLAPCLRNGASGRHPPLSFWLKI